MNWSNEWGKPVAPDWAKPQLDKITEDAKEASEWVKTVYPYTNLIVGTDISAYEIQQIKLGNKTIPVTIVGDLGLDFCEPGEKDQGWNIYHLPTLACFSSGVPSIICQHCLGHCNPLVDGSGYCNKCKGTGANFDYDKQPLLNWMAKIQENYPTSWQVLRLLTPDTYKDHGSVAKEIIQKWCLSVKVE